MWTNNMIAMQKVGFGITGQSIVNAAGTSANHGSYYLPECVISPCLLTAKNYSTVAGYAAVNYNTTTSSMRTSLGAGVYFGSGSTPANKNDYTLESFIPSGSLAITNPESLVEESNGAGQYAYSATYILHNTTDAEINIYEIGLFVPSSASTRKTSGTVVFNAVLIDRTVLSAPITIAPGTASVVTYKLTFNQTLNVE